MAFLFRQQFFLYFRLFAGKQENEKKILTYEYVKENIIDIGELKSTGKDKNEDIYDSLAIGYAYLKKYKFIE